LGGRQSLLIAVSRFTGEVEYGPATQQIIALLRTRLNRFEGICRGQQWPMAGRWGLLMTRSVR